MKNPSDPNGEDRDDIYDALEEADALPGEEERPNPGAPQPTLTEIDSCLTDRNN